MVGLTRAALLPLPARVRFLVRPSRYVYGRSMTYRLRLVLATLVAFLLLVAVIAFAPRAHATDDDGIALPRATTLVAWLITADDGGVWGDGQTYAAHLELEQPTLDALDGLLEECGFYQVDLYWSGPTTDALIAGGILYGPGNPAEDLAWGALGDGVDPWKYLTVETCPEVEPTPEPTPTEAPPTPTPEPTTEPTPTPAPTVTPEPTPTETTVAPIPTSGTPPVVVEIAQPATGAPMLAATGASPGVGFLVGLVVVVFGTTLVVVAHRRRTRS